MKSNEREQIYQWIHSRPNGSAPYSWVWNQFPEAQVGSIVDSLVQEGRLEFNARYQIVRTK